MTEQLNPESYAIPSIDELDAMRVTHGLSQKEFSRRAGVEAGRFNHILHNDIDPRTSTTRAFLEVLQETDVETEEDLASKRGPKPKPSTLTEKLDAADPDDLLTDGGLETTHLDEHDGLWIPPRYREFNVQIVFRTPRATIEHFQSGGGEVDAYYGMINESHFGDPDDMRDPKNPGLAPDRVSIKPRGEPATVLEVELDPPSLRADGGETGARSSSESECSCPDGIDHVRPPRKGGPPVEKTEYCDHCKEMIQRQYDHLDGKADAIHDRLVAEGRR